MLLSIDFEAFKSNKRYVFYSFFQVLESCCLHGYYICLTCESKYVKESLLVFETLDFGN